MCINTELFVSKTDAASRIAITVINQADSLRIAQLGNLSHDSFRGGFINGDGTTAVSADANCIRQVETQLVTYDLPVPARYYIPVEMFYEANPFWLLGFLKQILGQDDLVYLARSMRLDKIDFDRIHNGRFIRSFAENTTSFPWAESEFSTFDHLGNFNRKYVLYQGATFEVKCFKYTDRLGEYPLLFKPEHPGIWFPRPIAGNEPILLDTDVKAILNGTSKANAWLNDAGMLAELDAEIFRNRQVIFVWYSQNPKAKGQFESALRFLAAMEKHGITVEIMDADKTVSLDQNAMIRQAHRYGLTVPDNLKVASGFLSSDYGDGSLPENMPHFWTSGSSTLFFGPGQNRILEELLLSFGGKLNNEFPRKKMAILCPARTETRAGNLCRKTGVQVPLIGQNILRAEDDFEKLLCRESIELLFLICANEFSERNFIQVLDVCERSRVMTAAFTPGKDNLSDVDMELISQSYLAVAQDNNIILKDMKTNEINKYRFAQNKQTAVEPSSEEEIQHQINRG